jgi:muconate cycloisomerase
MNHMRFVKLKVGTDDDLSTLRLVRDELGGDVDIRVDANSAWTPSEAIARLREMEPYGISAVEQPVAKADFAGLKQVSEAVRIPVIADESLCNEEDARRLIDLKACGIFNLRLSKCGGPGAATRISRMAEAAGIRCQVGCHVGENQHSVGRRPPVRPDRAALILRGGLLFPLPAGPGCGVPAGGL